ncbi:MAG: hypothetical protein VX910_07935 [Candidatus Latescibacterota bacterium]|nr:hypothetical protein [Candidatus Latescibacterota bacterium]
MNTNERHFLGPNKTPFIHSVLTSAEVAAENDALHYLANQRANDDTLTRTRNNGPFLGRISYL